MKILPSVFLVSLMAGLSLSAQTAFYDAKLIGEKKPALQQFVGIMDEDPKLLRRFSENDMAVSRLKSSLNDEDLLSINRLRSFMEDPFSGTVGPFSCSSVVSSFNQCNDLVNRRLGPNINPPALSNIEPLPALNFGTNLIDATAQFLVQRTKMELSLAVFQQIEREFDGSLELRSLFPQSYRLLSLQSEESLPSMGPTWQSAFESDLVHLVDNLETYISSFPSNGVRQSEEVRLFLIALNAIHNFMQGNSGYATLSLLNAKHGDLNSSIGTTVRLLDLLSRNLRGTTEGNIWISVEEFLDLDTAEEREFFLALLYQQDSDLFDAIFRRLGLSEAQVVTRTQVFYQLTLDLLRSMQRMDQLVSGALHQLEEGQVESVDIQAYYLSAVLQLGEMLQMGLEMTDVLGLPLSEGAGSRLSPIWPLIISDTFSAWAALESRDYGQGLMHSIQLIDNLVRELAVQRGTGGYAIDRIFYYGNMMVDVLSAEDSATMQLVLDRYFQPVGSYRNKRNRSMALELNAFPGAFVASERLMGENLYSASAGITAPIGFALSRSVQGHSVSIFLPVVDISAPFSYRWANQAEGLPNNINWRQIFSPGVHFVWGVKNAPLSVMIGGQLSPQLRKIEVPDDDPSSSSSSIDAFRLGASISVDLPMLRLYAQ